MDFSEIEKEMAQIVEGLQVGRSACEAQQFEEGRQKLTETLALIEAGHPLDHPDRIECLTLLSDANAQLQRYPEALQCLHELLHVADENLSASIDRPALLLKLAKTAAKNGDNEEAQKWFEQTIDECSVLLGEGHPFMTLALESYSQFLERLPEAKGKAGQLRTQARVNRTRFKSARSISDGVLDKLQLSSDDSAAEQQGTGENRSLRSAPVAQSKSKMSKRDTILALLMLAVGLVIVSVVTVNQVNRSKADKSRASTLPPKPKIISQYQSVDGSISMTFYDNHFAEYKLGNSTRSVFYTNSSKEIKPEWAASTLKFVRHRDFLVDSDKHMFFVPQSPELREAANMEVLATACEEYYRFSDEYPDVLKKVAAVAAKIKNPINAALESVHVTYLGREKDWHADASDASLPASESYIARFGKAPGAGKLTPGCIYYYFYLCGTAESGIKVKIVYIVGTDRKGAPLSCTGNDSAYEFKLKNGLTVRSHHVASGRCEDVVRCMDQAIQLNKDLAQAYFYRGGCRVKLGDYQKAAQDFSRAIQSYPANARLYTARAGAYLFLKEFEKALADCNKALSLDPNEARAYDFRGAAYYELGRREDAQQEKSKAIELNANASDVYLTSTLPEPQFGAVKTEVAAKSLAAIATPARQNESQLAALIAKGDWSKIISCCNQMLTANADNVEALSSRGTANCKLGHSEQALADLNRCIKLKPAQAQLYAQRAACLKACRRIPAAIADLNKAVQLDPRSDTYLTDRGLLYASINQNEQAIIDFKHSSALNARNGLNHLYLGQMYLKSKDTKLAATEYSYASQYLPNDPSAYLGRAECYKMEGQLAEAVDDLGRALRIAPDNIEALTMRAAIAMELKRYPLANQDLDKAIALNPHYSEPFYLRSVLYKTLDQLDKALADLSTYAQLGGDKLKLATQRAQILMAKKDFPAALKDLNLLVENGGSDSVIQKQRVEAFFATNAYSEVVKASTRLLADSADDLEVVKMRALSYEQLRKYDLAVSDFTTLINHQPKIADWYNRRSACYKKLGEEAESVRDRAMADDLQAPSKQK